jgi:transcriptional regulator with XRE-family HTH domain
VKPFEKLKLAIDAEMPRQRREAAEKLGVTYNVLSNLLRGQSEKGIEQVIRRASRQFNIDEDWFYDEKSTAMARKVAPKVREESAPYEVASTRSVLLPFWAGMATEDGYDCVFTITKRLFEVRKGWLDAPADEYFVCSVYGPTLMPWANHSDKLLCRFDSAPEPNSLIVLQNKDGNYVIRGLSIDDKQDFVLTPINLSVPTVTKDEHWLFVASVVAIFGKVSTPERNITFNNGAPLPFPERF